MDEVIVIEGAPLEPPGSKTATPLDDAGWIPVYEAAEPQVVRAYCTGDYWLLISGLSEPQFEMANFVTPWITLRAGDVMLARKA